jgi:putative flippase GtrA
MRTFLKAQFSAFAGGLIDYLFMLFFTEICGVFYPVSIVLSGFIGAVVNFTVNKYWTFNAKAQPTGKQLQRFVWMVVGSVILKSGGTYLLTQLIGFNYKWSRLMVDLMVSLGFNFPLQKYWVFNRPKYLNK